MPGGGEIGTGLLNIIGLPKGQEIYQAVLLFYSSSPVCPEINEHETTHVSSVDKHMRVSHS